MSCGKGPHRPMPPAPWGPRTRRQNSTGTCKKPANTASPRKDHGRDSPGARACRAGALGPRGAGSRCRQSRDAEAEASVLAPARPGPGGGREVGGAGQPAASPRSAGTCMPARAPPGAWLAAARAGVRGAHSCHAICSAAGSPAPCALSERPRRPRTWWRWGRWTRPAALSAGGLWGAGGELHGTRGRRSAPPQGWARDGAQRGHGLRSRVWRPRRAGQQPQSPQPCTPVGPTLAHSRDSPTALANKMRISSHYPAQEERGKKSVNKTSVAMETIKNSSPTLPPLLVTYS